MGPDPRSAYKFSEVGHKWSFDQLTSDQRDLHEMKSSMVDNEVANYE